MKILEKLMFLNMLKPSTWSPLDTIAVCVDTFARQFLHTKAILKETTVISRFM